MALIHCSSCGKQVSEQAAACPHCGHPIAGHNGGGSWVKRVFLWGGVAVLATVLLLVVIGLFGDSTNAEKTTESARTVTPPPAADFTVMEHSQRDDECTEIGDYCIRVHCTFYNKGNGAGEKAIGAQLLDGSDSVAVRQSTLTLLPDNSQKLYFDFKEAELDGEHHYASRCLVSDRP